MCHYNDFAGVVEISTSSETCPEKENTVKEENDDDDRTCYKIKVLESFNENIEPESIETIEIENCGSDYTSPSGTFVVSGKVNGNNLFLPRCSNKRILKKVNSLEDPQVNKYRDLSKGCKKFH